MLLLGRLTPPGILRQAYEVLMRELKVKREELSALLQQQVPPPPPPHPTVPPLFLPLSPFRSEGCSNSPGPVSVAP